mmetsp:Transcript_10857/g.16357  ORF Transcript_10857/g.16357 Transcript_10857/m.16357 type:complete len:80 (-) Transcript_10857:200-439(-)
MKRWFCGSPQQDQQLLDCGSDQTGCIPPREEKYHPSMGWQYDEEGDKSGMHDIELFPSCNRIPHLSVAYRHQMLLLQQS